MPEKVNLDALGVEVIRAALFGDVRIRERLGAEVAWRASGDPEQKDVRVLTGYPAVFSQVYTLYEGSTFVMQEQVDPGFFDDVLTNDCHLNYSHVSESAMCRNNPCMPADKQGGPGSMELSTDAHGLRVFARVPMNDLDAQRLAPKMDNGVVDQMSYAFQVGEEDLSVTQDPQGRDIYLYTLRKCSRLMDVCVCPLGANSQTESMLRAFSVQLSGRSQEGRGGVAGRSPEGSQDGADRSNEGRTSVGEVAAKGLAASLRFHPREEA